MTMLGSEEERFDCILDSQDKILEKLASIDKAMGVQEEKLTTYVQDFKDRTLHEYENRKQIHQLVSVIDKVYEKQKILLEERQSSIDFWKKMKHKVVGSGIIGSFMLLGSVVWYAVQQFIVSGPKG